MLKRHLLGEPAKIGVGANRAATAAAFFKQYGYVDPCNYLVDQKFATQLDLAKIGAVILDDGMQVHWCDLNLSFHWCDLNLSFLIYFYGFLVVEL